MGVKGSMFFHFGKMTYFCKLNTGALMAVFAVLALCWRRRRSKFAVQHVEPLAQVVVNDCTADVATPKQCDNTNEVYAGFKIGTTDYCDRVLSEMLHLSKQLKLGNKQQIYPQKRAVFLQMRFNTLTTRAALPKCCSTSNRCTMSVAAP